MSTERYLDPGFYVKDGVLTPIPVEFHLAGQHNQQSHAGSRAAGAGLKETTGLRSRLKLTEKQARRAKIASIALGAVVVVAAGLALNARRIQGVNAAKKSKFLMENPQSSSGGFNRPSEDELRERLAAATKTRLFSGGRSGAAVIGHDGPKGRVVTKSGLFKDKVDANYLASKVAEALGANIPTVTRVDDTSLIMDHADGEMAGSFTRDIGRIIPFDRNHRERVAKLQGGKELAMFDIATNNRDRHGGNIIVSPDGKSVAGIDHDLSFRFPRSKFRPIKNRIKDTILPPPRALSSTWKKELRKSDYEKARRRLLPLRNEFKELGREEWFFETIERLSREERLAKR